VRILHTESSLGWGGQEMRIVAEAAGFAARGADVTIAAPEEAAILARAAERGVCAVALPIARKHPASLYALRRFLRARRGRLDVVNTHSSTDTWLTALAVRSLRGAPAFVRTRHLSSALSDNRATRWLYTRAPQHIVVTGERLRDNLHRQFGTPLSHVTSVPTGIDLARFRPRDRAQARAAKHLGDGTWIGVLAALRNWKGHAFLLDALAMLASHPRAPRLLVIGDGPQRRNLERRVADMGLGERVRFEGFRDDPERYLPALDVFVLPSYGDEGVSQAAMQAMACALPVVVTDVGGMRDAVTPDVTGVMVPARDAAALAAAIARLLDDAEFARALAERAHVKAQAEFGLDRMLDRMQTGFERAIARTSR
jgi:glycosyltransferase involved in cell wall biosynthesis